MSSQIKNNSDIFPLGRPSPGDLAKVYVPISNDHGIVPGSGIVGFARDPEDASSQAMIVYYEGNTIGAENLTQWVDRVRQAYGRMSISYPTIAKSYVNASDFLEVGFTNGNQVTVTNRDQLEAYLEASECQNSSPAEDVSVRPVRPYHPTRGAYR